MSKIRPILFLLLILVGCKGMTPLDIKVQRKNSILGNNYDQALYIKNLSSNSWTDILVTICPLGKSDEYYYHIEKLPAKENITISIKNFKSDTDIEFPKSRTFGKVKINCNEGWWENDRN